MCLRLEAAGEIDMLATVVDRRGEADPPLIGGRGEVEQPLTDRCEIATRAGRDRPARSSREFGRSGSAAGHDLPGSASAIVHGAFGAVVGAAVAGASPRPRRTAGGPFAPLTSSR